MYYDEPRSKAGRTDSGRGAFKYGWDSDKSVASPSRAMSICLCRAFDRDREWGGSKLGMELEWDFYGPFDSRLSSRSLATISR